jgi:hypothetical protein
MLVGLFVLATAGTLAEAITGTQKVIQLLGDMEAKAKQAKNAEEVEFSKFNQFCTNKKASTAKEIKQAEELMETLTADIGKLESDIQKLAEDIETLQREVATDQSELKEAKAQREKDHASYSEEIQDFSESVDALDRAIATLKKQTYDRKQAESVLLQLTTSAAIPDKVQRTVTAYLEMSTGEEGMLPASPEANAYEFQSGGIVELLEKLHEEFTEKKSEAEKEEMNSRAAFEMMSQDLHDSIENAEANIATKTGIKAEKTEIKAQKTKELGVTKAGHAEDTKYLSELTAECFEKNESFKEKQQLRTDEIAAIGEAMKILKSPDVLGSSEKHLPSSLVQSATGASLAQLRAHQEPDSRVQAVKFLRIASRRLHSQRLGMIAERVSTSSDPFAKVKKMIDDMITKLLEETNQESEQKGFCDKELGTNQKTRTKLQGTIDELSAKIDENEAMITSNTQRIAELSKELADLSDSMKESTELRNEEKAKNTETIKDAQEAIKAIEAATAVLKDFYEKASSATALLQDGRPTMGSEEWNALANPNYEGQAGYGQGSEDKVDKGHKAGMQTFGKKYTGMQDEAGGVFAMLEVISSDFSAVEADTKSSEAAAVEAYKDFMADSKKATAVKEKEVEMLTSDKATAKSESLADTKDMKATQDQLLAANRYYDKLKPTCVDSGISYADRVKAREEEIQSLKEALTILEGQ